MEPGKLRELLTTMREFGVTKLKTADVELELGEQKKPEPVPEVSPEKLEQIKHSVEEAASLMKLNDTELVDRLFPTQTYLSPDEAPPEEA